MTGPDFKIVEQSELGGASFGTLRSEDNLEQKCTMAGVCSMLRRGKAKEKDTENYEELDRHLDELDANRRHLTQTTYFHLQRIGEDVPTPYRIIRDYDRAEESQLESIREGLRCLPGFECIDDEKADHYLKSLANSESELLRISTLLATSGLVREDWVERISSNIDQTVAVLDNVVSAGQECFEVEFEEAIARAEEKSSGLLSRAIEVAHEILDDIFDFNDHDVNTQDRDSNGKSESAKKLEEKGSKKPKILKGTGNQNPDLEATELVELEARLQESEEIERDEDLEELEVEQLWNEIAEAIAGDIHEAEMEEAEELAEDKFEMLAEETEESGEIQKLFAECPQIANLAVAIGLTQEDWTEAKSQAFLEMVKSWYLSRRSVSWHQVEAA